MSKYIKKTLYLPSGGVEYSPLAFIDKVDAAYMFMRADPFSIESMFDLLTSTINFYCELPTAIENMYTIDIYYIWSLMTMMDFDKKYLESGVVCGACRKEYDVKIRIEIFDSVIGNKYDGFIIPINTHEVEDFVFSFKPRKVIHNYTFAAGMQKYLLANGKETNTAEKYILFCATQLESLTYQGVQIDKKDWSSAIRSMYLKDMFESCHLRG